jgi:hypothetical protein
MTKIPILSTAPEGEERLVRLSSERAQRFPGGEVRWVPLAAVPQLLSHALHGGVFRRCAELGDFCRDHQVEIDAVLALAAEGAIHLVEAQAATGDGKAQLVVLGAKTLRAVLALKAQAASASDPPAGPESDPKPKRGRSGAVSGTAAKP